MSQNLAVKMVNITKRFPGVVANDKVNFELKIGEVHALLGENGAGKTTLVNILCGLYEKDSGEIYVWGKKVEIRSPKDAIRLGIFMVPQTPKLASSLSVIENIVIGLKNSGIIMPIRKIRKKVVEIRKKYNIIINPDAKIYQLSAAEQKRVEIIKALIRGAKILIFDEPTATLSPPEKQKLFRFMRQFADEGNSVIFITHKISEALEVSDRITVMRKGKVIGTVLTKDATPSLLTRWMFGTNLNLEINSSKVNSGKILLKVVDLWVKNDAKEIVVKGISFDLFSGEILGVAGVAGNGQKELVEALVGLRPVARGKIFVDSGNNLVEITRFPPKIRIKYGISFIPDDRIRYGIVPDMSIMENLLLGFHDKKEFTGAFLLKWAEIKKWAEKLVKKYRIIAPNLNTPAKYLSGGNIQRLILAREMARNPKIIIAAYPTLGLDAFSTQYIRNTLVKLKEKGVGILLISEDLDELFELSDRIMVMSDGRIKGILPKEKASIEIVGKLMTKGDVK